MRTSVLIAALFVILPCWSQTPELVIVHKASHQVGFYTLEGKLTHTVEVGRHPHEMVLSRDRRQVYVTDNGVMRLEHGGQGGNTLSVVDLATRRRTKTISLGEYRRPHGIALDPATGRIAVSTEAPDQLLLVDPETGSVLRRYDTKGKTSHMVVFGPGGKVAYVSNSGSATVAAVDLESGHTTLIPTAERPEGSALSIDGRELYVVNREAARITIIDTVRQQVKGTIATGNGPVRVAVTPDGKMLVYALLHDSHVEFADPKSRRVLGRVALTGKPVSLTLSPDGKLAYASAEEGDTVFVISVAEQRVLRSFKTPAGSGPDPVFHLTVKR